MPYKDPEAARACKRRYYERNRAEVIARATAWNANNRERHNEISRAYADRNRLRYAQYHTLRHARQQLERSRHRAEALYA